MAASTHLLPISCVLLYASQWRWYAKLLLRVWCGVVGSTHKEGWGRGFYSVSVVREEERVGQAGRGHRHPAATTHTPCALQAQGGTDTHTAATLGAAPY